MFESTNGGGDEVRIVRVEGIEVVVCRVEVDERGEEVAGDDLGEGGCVFVFVEDDLTV